MSLINPNPTTEEDRETTVKRPCEACGDREAAATIEGVDLCGGCASRVEDEPAVRRLLSFVGWLSPTRRRDWLACEVAGDRRKDQADERGVDASVVSKNVSAAYDRLGDVAAEQGEA